MLDLLWVWMDSKINLREHHNICMKKAKGVEARIRRLAGPTELQPQQVRQIQVATMQAVALYGAEL